MNWAVARAMTERQKAPKSGPRFPRRTVEELLEAARATEARALARFEKKNIAVQKYEALKKRRDRKLDTRRKIIAGALVLEHMKHDAEFADRFHSILDRYVDKAPERLLFGLPTKAKRLGNP